MSLIESVSSFAGKKHKSLAALFAVQLLLCGINSPAQSKDGVTANEIVIGSCCVQSGPASELGTQQLIGAQTYLSYINDKGGVHGRKITLKKYDDGYEPDKAVVQFKKMAGDDCFAGAFFVGTPTAAKYVPMAEEHKIPIVGLFTGAQLLQDPFRPHVISVRASYFDETANQIDHIWKDLGPQKVAVIYQDDAFGNAVLSGVNKALAKHDSKPVALGSFQRNTTDVSKAIASVKTAKPDVVFVVGPYAPVAEVLKESHSQSWKPIFTTVSFVGTEALIKAAGQDAEGMVISQVVPPLTRDDLATVVLYKKLLHQYNPSAKPNFTSFEGFVDAMVLVEGLQAAGKDVTREKLIQALEGIKEKDMGLGPSLKLTYGPARHKGFDQVYTTVIRDGQTIAFFNWKLVKPKG
jgi:ABC-type branched-subunit amino acid transport system substrate-binding protein